MVDETIKPKKKQNDRIERCSFCDKTRNELEILISGGPDIFICNECVDICSTVIKDHRDKKNYSDRRSVMKFKFTKQQLPKIKTPVLGAYVSEPSSEEFEFHVVFYDVFPSGSQWWKWGDRNGPHFSEPDFWAELPSKDNIEVELKEKI